MNSNLTEPVKGHLTESDFREFRQNLRADGLNQSTWIRDQVKNYNLAKRITRSNNPNIVSITKKF